MIQAYLLSIFIWMATIVLITTCTKDKVLQNGWLDGTEPATFSHGIVTLILVAATPIFRVIICAVMIYMTRITKEQYEEEHKDEGDE